MDPNFQNLKSDPRKNSQIPKNQDNIDEIKNKSTNNKKVLQISITTNKMY